MNKRKHLHSEVENVKVLTRKSDITINNRKMRVGELITNLKSLPSTEVRDFFIKQKKMIPRQVRMDVLKGIIDTQLKDKKVAGTLTDEMNYRMNWYNKFSEYQYENLLAYFNNPTLTDLFKEELWLAIVCRHDDLSIDDITLFTLYQKSINFKIQSDNNEDLKEYNRTMDCIFYDEPGAIDGLKYDDFRENLLQSSTLVELREIGTKYGIDVPRRIKKNELMDIIIDELKQAGKMNDELEEKIKKMSVVGLQRLAKDNDIKASIELKKGDIIEYIIKFMSVPEVPGAEKATITEPVLQEEEEVEETPEAQPDAMEEVDYSKIDIADLFAPEVEETKTKDPDVIVPDAIVNDEPIYDDGGMMDMPFDDVDMGIEMGMDMDTGSMMDDTPAADSSSDQTVNEGADPLDGIDAADLDIFMDTPSNGPDAVFQFENTNYEEPSVTAAPNTNMFDESSSSNQAQMNGFKSELNEFNRKLESLLAFQMKMLEKNQNQASSSGEKKADNKGTKESAGGDLFTIVQNEVKEEKINQARGLDELRKMAEANGGVMPGVKGAPIVQDSYLPSKKEQEKENKRKAKERERAKKFMSKEELEFTLEQERREKEAAKRLRDAEKAKKENTMGSGHKSPLVKVVIALAIILIAVLIFLLVVYFLCHEGIVKDGILRDIYDFFRDIRDTLSGKK